MKNNVQDTHDTYQNQSILAYASTTGCQPFGAIYSEVFWTRRNLDKHDDNDSSGTKTSYRNY